MRLQYYIILLELQKIQMDFDKEKFYCLNFSKIFPFERIERTEKLVRGGFDTN
jgi:hypothetical protein